MATLRLRFLALAVAAVLLGVATAAVAAESECHVRYVSAESVYLDAGSTAGLAVGDRLRVVQGKQAVSELEVVFVAEHSASCRVVGGAAAVKAGDRVVWDEAAGAPAPAAPDTLASRQRTVAAGPAVRTRRVERRVDGWLALQWDRSVDASDRDLTTDLLSLPFRLRARELGHDWEFRARGSLRRLSRQGFGEATAADEWRNRVLEAALVREGRELPWQFAVGRVGGRQTAAVGPFDGLAVTRRLGATTTFGVFGGWVPAWGELSLGGDAQVAGATFRVDRAGAGGAATDLVISAVGRYHGGDIDREYFAQTFTWRDGARWSLLESTEFDLYRGWRRADGGRSLALTGGALTGRCQVTRALALTAGYDGREPVRTWETRTLPDSLFTDAARTGWRAGASLRGAGGFGLDASGGVRHGKGSGEDVSSWQVLARAPGRALGGFDLTLTARGFDGPWLSGWSPGLRLSRGRTTRWWLDAGRFSYDGKLAGQTRDNTWGELGLSREMGGGWDATASYRLDRGDDVTGRRLFAELARRF